MVRPLNILFVTFYYRPDLCAGSFRATSLVEALQVALPAGSRIDVMTTEPNRYNTFTTSAASVERSGCVQIERMPVPAHAQDMRGQARTFAHFARGAIRATRGRPYDLVFATSSRLMSASLGAWLARRAKTRLYLDIRDIFADTIGDILPGVFAGPMKLAFGGLESWTLKRAERINFVSRGFEPYFRKRYPHSKFSWFTNGIDDEFLTTAPATPPVAATAGTPLHVLYAGNMGEGQGLHRIIPELARATQGRMRFTIIGDGGRRAALEAGIAAAGVTNVELRKPAPRDQLIEQYRAADVLFLHLNAHAAFEKVLPSKIFEYAAMRKPIWAGVSGHAAEFLRQEVPNAAVFAPCDAEGALRSFAGLSLGETSRDDFVARYSRSSIARMMAEEIIAVGSGNAVPSAG